MSRRNVFDFLRITAARPDVLDSLKVRSKDDVIAAATDFGQPFSEEEFDSLVWALEQRLAATRGEGFDISFPLWSTMWGKYYLEYLVLDLMPSLAEADFAAVEAARAGTS
jgi:hypothetical protein